MSLPGSSVPLPGALLWQLASKSSSPVEPAQPLRLSALAKPANASLLSPGSAEVFLRWDCSAASRSILSDAIQFSTAGPAGPWAAANAPPFPADIMCAFTHAAPLSVAAYRVAAVDFWGRQGAWSEVAAPGPWPAL